MWIFKLWPLLCAVALGACASAGVVPPDTTTPTVSRVLDGTLVDGPMRRPGRTIAQTLLAVQSGDARLDHAERHLAQLLERSGVANQVLIEADLGPQGAPEPAFLVSYRMLNFQSTSHGPDGRWLAGLIAGVMTGGLGFLIAINSHANFTHNFEFEVRVYDVRGAPVVRATEDDGTIVNRYDTSVAAPLIRRTYNHEMRTWIGAGTNGPSGADLQRHLDEQGGVLAQIMYDLSISDVVSALRRGVAQPPAQVAPSAAPAATAPPSIDPDQPASALPAWP